MARVGQGAETAAGVDQEAEMAEIDCGQRILGGRDCGYRVDQRTESAAKVGYEAESATRVGRDCGKNRL